MKTASRGPRPLDRTDRLILKCLQEDGRLSNVALARKVNLTPTPCLERVRRLGGRRDRVGCPGERDEKGIALGVDLDATVSREGVP